VRVLLFLFSLSATFPAFAQAPEKKVEKKKAAAKKSVEPKQDWGRFNTNAKKDMKAIEEKKAKK
jgi:hypothetical protein